MFFHVEYDIWHCLEHGFCQINWNSLFLAIQRLQEHLSLYSAYVFWDVFFIKKLIAFSIIFWQLYQIHTFNNNDEEMRTSHFNFELNYKTTFYDKKS